MRDFRSVHLGERNIAAFALKADAIAFARKAKRGWSSRHAIKAYNRFNIFWVIAEQHCDDLIILAKDGSCTKLIVTSPTGAIK